MENTVTISLEKYEEMKSEIERLRKENAEKTIIQHESHWVVKLCALIIASGIVGIFLYTVS